MQGGAHAHGGGGCARKPAGHVHRQAAGPLGAAERSAWRRQCPSPGRAILCRAHSKAVFRLSRLSEAATTSAGAAITRAVSGSIVAGGSTSAGTLLCSLAHLRR